jgi:peroxiredoxin Q/BCP
VQAVRDALPDLTAAGVAVMGISPDTVAQQKKFHDKHDPGFPLLSDENRKIAEAYGVWAEKKMAGKTYMGIVRSAFLIEQDGSIAATSYKISPKNTVPTLLQWLADAQHQ